MSEHDLESFVTFALGMKPALTIHRKPDTYGPNMTLTVSVIDKITESEIDSLEPLMAKYRPLKSHLDAIRNTKEEIAHCSPTSNFESNVHYRLIRVTERQYKIANEVATRLDRIHNAHSLNDLNTAKREYDNFHEYLSEQRAGLIGEFEGVGFTDAVATYGADRLRYDDDCSGAVIFVIIEIFIV